MINTQEVTIIKPEPNETWHVQYDSLLDFRRYEPFIESELYCWKKDPRDQSVRYPILQMKN